MVLEGAENANSSKNSP